jgi:hypothetical protein
MPDLSSTHVLTWLSQRNPHLAATLDPFHSPETDPEVAGALVALGAALDKARADAPSQFAVRLQSGEAHDLLHSLMNGLGPARMTRLLDWLSEPEMPRRDAVLTSLLQSPRGSSNSLRSALTVLNRQILLKQIIADERVFSLVAACQSLATRNLS